MTKKNDTTRVAGERRVGRKYNNDPANDRELRTIDGTLVAPDVAREYYEEHRIDANLLVAFEDSRALAGYSHYNKVLASAIAVLVRHSGAGGSFTELRDCFPHRVSAANDASLEALTWLVRAIYQAIRANDQELIDRLKNMALSVVDGHDLTNTDRILAARECITEALNQLMAEIPGETSPSDKQLSGEQLAKAREVELRFGVAGHVVDVLSLYDRAFFGLDRAFVLDFLQETISSNATATQKKTEVFVLAHLMDKVRAFGVTSVADARDKIKNASSTAAQRQKRER
jgi:hypothetical protein